MPLADKNKVMSMSDNKNKLPDNNNNPDPDYWRSFEELYNDPAFIETSGHEFMKGVTDDFNPDKLSGFSRRKFFALVGASAALAAAGCANLSGRDSANHHFRNGTVPGQYRYENARGLLQSTTWRGGLVSGWQPDGSIRDLHTKLDQRQPKDHDHPGCFRLKHHADDRLLHL